MKNNYLKFNKNIEVLTNGFDGDLNTAKVILDEKFTLVHVGMLNADRNPKILWKVLSELIVENENFANDFQLKLIGKLAKEVTQSIEKHQLVSVVKNIDYLPHKEVITYQKSAQVLLITVNNVPSAKGIITGKIFEYLQAQRPILAIAPTDGDLAEIIQSTNSGTTVGFKDKANLKKSILEFYNAYKNDNLAINSKGVEQYHRKELTAQLAKIIKNVPLRGL